MKNNNFDWLTYETVFNKPKFRKSNKKYKMGLYLVPRDKVTVWFRNNLHPDLLRVLTDAFFPDHDPEKHFNQSKEIWDWKKEKGETAAAATVKKAETPQTEPINTSGATVVLNEETFIVLPYNYYDNQPISKALGTDNKLDPFLKQLKEDNTWDFWKTASRSSVVRTARVKDKGVPWTGKQNPEWKNWNFELGNADREKAEELLKENADAYSFKPVNAGDVSLKTGVIFVGRENQQKNEKDCLDSNWIVACLRSDYVDQINQEAKNYKEEYKRELLVLTELLSVNEAKCRPDRPIKDGIQVRDLSPLNKDNMYMAPLCIPFVDLDFVELQEEFAHLANKKWCDYWKKNWAESLGRTKALLLLRYGLQHINPNVQNYLIEFEIREKKPTPTGRIIVRDLQDAALHREVAWALYGEATELPPEGPGNKAQLSRLKLPVLEYEFTKEITQSQETGDTNPQFGPHGTQFLWQRFSAFTNAGKVKEDPTYSKYWNQLLFVMADWGRAHNREYVRCVERQLGINFSIDWSSMKNPEAYLSMKEVPKYTGFEYLYPTDAPQTPAHPTITKVQSGMFPGPQGWNDRFALQVLEETEIKRLADLKLKNDTYKKDKQTLEATEEQLVSLRKSRTPDTVEIKRLEELVKTQKEQLAKLEGELGTSEYAELQKKRDSFFQSQDNKSLFNQSCILIVGANFRKGATVSFDGTPAERVVWRNGTELYVKTKGGTDTLNRVAILNNLPITVTNPPPPAETSYTLNCRPPSTDQSWEEETAKLIHNYLRSMEGQDAIRNYRKRGWEPIPPKFYLRFMAEDGNPFEQFPVTVKIGDGAKSWVDLTDCKGEIPIFKHGADECQIAIPGYIDGFLPVKKIEEKKKMTLSFTGKPVVEVQFFHG